MRSRKFCSSIAYIAGYRLIPMLDETRLASWVTRTFAALKQVINERDVFLAPNASEGIY